MKVHFQYRRLRSKLLTLVASAIVGLLVVGPGFAGIDETMGGLPGNGGGNELPGMPDRRPSIFVEGSYTEVAGVVLSFRGSEPELIPVGGGRVRRVFHGNQELVLDEYVLQTSSVQLGVLASPVAGQMKYSLVWDAHSHTPFYSLAEGGALLLPYARLLDLGLVDGPIGVRTWNRLSGRSSVQLERVHGQIHIHVQH